jgi:hypothetical protein
LINKDKYPANQLKTRFVCQMTVFMPDLYPFPGQGNPISPLILGLSHTLLWKDFPLFLPAAASG